MSIISTCLVLFAFKYFNFFNSNFAFIAKTLGLNYPIGVLEVILPVGLSFHTFQSLSYVIEVYRGKQKAEHHFGIYSLYVMFYPQLVAGPIERPQNLLPQFYEKHYFEYDRVTDGLKLILWGLFKKIVIADRLAVIVNQVYDAPTMYNGTTLLVSTIFFAFQIYCDFSGYSNIAIGTAKVMGFRLMTNFNRPYFSKSISEFWKRWHISLSTWFKDYFYISLGGNKCSKPRWHMNLFLTFLVSGLWHGANWTYIIWGGLNGFYLVFSLWTGSIRGKIEDFIGVSRNSLALKLYRIIVTFSLICFSWIFFRAKSLTDAFYIVKSIFSSSVYGGMASFQSMQTTSNEFWLCVLLIAFLLSFQLLQRSSPVRNRVALMPISIRWLAYYVSILGVYYLRVENIAGMQFIYFQF